MIGNILQLVGETLCETADVQAGSQVLDVACGNGNAALAAAHRFCKVVGVDYVPALLQRARERAAAERPRSSSSKATPRRCRSRPSLLAISVLAGSYFLLFSGLWLKSVVAILMVRGIVAGLRARGLIARLSRRPG